VAHTGCPSCAALYGIYTHICQSTHARTLYVHIHIFVYIRICIHTYTCHPRDRYIHTYIYIYICICIGIISRYLACSSLQCFAVAEVYCSVLWFPAECCSVLQCDPKKSTQSVMQRDAV